MAYYAACNICYLETQCIRFSCQAANITQAVLPLWKFSTPLKLRLYSLWHSSNYSIPQSNHYFSSTYYYLLNAQLQNVTQCYSSYLQFHTVIIGTEFLSQLMSLDDLTYACNSYFCVLIFILLISCFSGRGPTISSFLQYN